MVNKLGQVWIETVIYTLIAFILIGSVLAFVRPKIEEFKDNAIIEQTRGMISDINEVMLSIVQGGAGNKRIIEINLRKGSLNIDGIADDIIFEMKSRSTYTEPGKDVNLGGIIVHTKKRDRLNLITLKSNYSNLYNITFQNKDEIKKINKGPTPYKLSISNEGRNKIINSSICTDITLNNDCGNITGYSKSCSVSGLTLNCTYTSNKIIINMDVL